MSAKSIGIPFSLSFFALICYATSACADPSDDLAGLSLEQLGDVIITSVSRQEERLSNAAASIYIINSSDIARIGARSLPEALRLAPNLQVARADARNYGVTARGFNSVFANKLLVLIDGRSIYSPLTSGVYWDAQDVAMADVERIEIISGPGATIYGVNAVNGVINIITKSAKDSRGGMIEAIASAHDKSGTVRYGGKLANNAYYRAYAKTVTVDDTFVASGKNTEMGFRRSQAGFRADWDLDRAGLTIGGDAYSGRLGQKGTSDIHIGGVNLNGRHVTKLEHGADLSVQFILDHTERNQPGAFHEKLNTLDLSMQHNARMGGRHRLSWGGGYRYSMDRVVNANAFAFLPGKLNLHWGNLFAQDEIALGAAFKVTAGVKAEHNNYTGFEYLPNLRVAWTSGASRLVWASLARSVRAPSRVDRDLHAPVKAPFFIGGGPDFVSETVDVTELGYRAQASARFSYSATLFEARYDKLATLEKGRLSVLEYRNLGKGVSRGIEAWGRWQPVDNWRLSGGVTVQRIVTSLYPGSRGVAGFAGLATADPKRRWVLRSSHDLPNAQQLDIFLRYNSGLSNPAVPAYHELDAQWLWKLRPDTELALVGQDLLHASHGEYGAAAGRSLIERTVALKFVQRF